MNGSRIRIVQADDKLSYTCGNKPFLEHLDKPKHLIAEDTAREDMKIAIKAMNEHAKTVAALQGVLVEMVASAVGEC